MYWNPDTFNIYAIGLYDANEEALGEILNVSIPLTAFETMWLDTAQSASEVFAFIFNDNNQMEGNDAENTFVPGLGNDEVFGGGDNSINDYDYVNYAADNRQHGITVDLVDGDAADDMGKVTSRGGAPETDILHSINSVYATAHDDLLIGDDHDNEFYAGFGNDTIHGGDGAVDNFDLLSYRGPEGRTQGITVTFTAQGTGTLTSNEQGPETDQFTGIEAVYGTAGNDRFTGAAGFQRFRGFAGNDIFDGGAGDDEVDYRSDTAEVAGKAGININLSNANAQGAVTVAGVNGDVDTLINIERIRGTRNDDTITGSAGSNRLRGDAGSDVISGLNGDDRLEGGAGNDTLNGGAGWDTFDGGVGDDVMIGGVGADTDEDYFTGSLGNDTIYGGDVEQNDDPGTNWNDLSYGGGTFSGIEVTFTSGNRYGTGTVVKKVDGEIVGTDQFFNVHAVRGTSGADKFTGAESSVAQRFIGFGGADVFDGTNGVNEVDYRADYRAAPVNLKRGMTIDLRGGDTVTITDLTGAADTLTRIERIRGTEADDRIYGNALNNRLRGDNGNDLLSGEAGNDQLEGGAGTDTVVYSGSRSNYHVTNNGTTLTIADQRSSGEGVDTVLDVEVFNFGGTVLNLAEVINHGSAINLAGGMVFENSKTGEDVGTLSVANPDALSTHTYTLINDAGGRFQLASDNRTIEVKNGLLLDYEQALTHTVVVRATDQFGKSVDQTLTIVVQDVAKETTTGTSGGDTVSGGSSTDNLSGGGGNDNLDGGGGKDKINGGIGNDRIIGGAGQDSLTGGSGKDVFAFASKDTGTSKGTADYITDFSGKGGDRIDLKLIDADTKKKGDQAFSFIGKNAFTKAGQVRYEKAGKDTYVYLNTDSDKTAEGVIKLKGAMDLQKSWFVL